MINITHTTISKKITLPIISTLCVFLSACESNTTSILDLDSLFPEGVLIQTLPDNQTNTNTSTNGPSTDTSTNTDTGLSTNTEPDTTGPTVTMNPPTDQIPAELALLTEGEIITQSRFGGVGDPIEDSFILPASSYEPGTNGDAGFVSQVSGNTIVICSYVFLTGEYLCLNAFDLVINDRVWYLFTMQSNTNGSGVFEFCTVENTTDDCLNKLIDDPDGTTSITINRTRAITLLPDASPYFAYENQATLHRRSSDVVVSEHYVNTMNTLITAAASVSQR